MQPARREGLAASAIRLMRGAVLGGAALLAGCAFPIDQDVSEASRLADYAKRYDHVVGPEKTPLDRALADCGEKTVKAETACVRRMFEDGTVSPKQLMATIPGCHAGQICHYEHTTRDDLGFLQATATQFIVRWRVDVDFRHPAADLAHVPFTVRDRDNFDATAPDAPKG